MVSDHLERIGDHVVWGPNWKGLEITWFTDLSSEEISQKPRSLDTNGCHLSLAKESGWVHQMGLFQLLPAFWI